MTNTLTILIIEDDASIRDSLADILEAESYTALTAMDGQQGIKLACNHQPNLIICDVMMPGLDGYGVLEALGNDPQTAAIPFIFLTAKSEIADMRKGMVLGADDYLTKPASRQDLLNAISSRLKRHSKVLERFQGELQEWQSRYEHLAHFDPLTRLPNQLLFREKVHQALSVASSNTEMVAVLVVELAHLNPGNYGFGRENREQLVKSAAERLIRCIGGSQATLARFQTEAFALLLPAVRGEQEVVQVCQAVDRALGEQFMLADHEVTVSSHQGIALSTEGSQAGQLVNQAETALAFVRDHPNNTNFEFYRPEMAALSNEQLFLEAGLRRGLERGEFEVYYQPQLELKTNRLIGAEALVRWRHPQRGLISPASFIPLAEKTGLIVPLGEWVLETACAQVQAWHKAGWGSLRIGINLSGKQFNQANLAKRIVEILEKSGLAPEYVDLELTESIIAHDLEVTVANLKELKELGIRISIDDFGTGYSSLSYLKSLPVDTLKIDQSFVRQVTNDAEYAVITTTIIQLAHSLKLKVVAEGIETVEEEKFLIGNDCDEGQGYLYSRPVSVVEFEKLLNSWLLSEI